MYNPSGLQEQPMPSYRASDSFVSGLGLQAQPLVSVITPVYNGGEFLADCIESVLAQTYQNWDCTIVNNCSQDRTLEIAQSYAAKDSRIRVVDCGEFLSIIPNHNRAIHQISANSKYCKVVMADDLLFPDCIMRMVSLAEANPSVGIVGAYGLYGDGVHVIWRGVPYPRVVVPGREVCRMRLLGGPYVFGTPTATLIRSDFIRRKEKFYDEANLHADSTVCYQILQEADFGFLHQILAFSRTRGESNTSFAERMNSLQLGFLTDLLEFGPIFLDKDEYRQRLKVLTNDYYKVLAEGLLQMRGKSYWEFHRGWLRNLGVPISWTKLMGGCVRAMLDGISHPTRAFGSLSRWWLNGQTRQGA